MIIFALLAYHAVDMTRSNVTYSDAHADGSFLWSSPSFGTASPELAAPPPSLVSRTTVLVGIQLIVTLKKQLLNMIGNLV